MLSDFRKLHGIQDALRRHAAFPRHLDAPMHVVEFGNRMGVRIDAHHAAEVERGLVPAPIQVEAPGMRVDLTATACLAQARSTFSTSMSYPGRRSNCRPVM